MGTESNLISGPLDVYVGPLGESLPDLDDIAPGASGIIAPTPAGNWGIIGFSVKDEDFKLLYTPTYEDVFVNEATAAVDSKLDKEEASLGYMAAEQDMTAWNQIIHAGTLATQAAGADQTAQDQFGVGHPSSEPTKLSMLLYGKNPEGGTRAIHIYKVLSVDPAEFGHGRKHVGTPIMWRIFEDTTKTLGERLFKVYDLTANATG